MDTDRLDVNCHVCYELMLEPVRMPCKHYLCFSCLEKVLSYKRTCPLCRADIPPFFQPKINQRKRKDIKRKQHILALKDLKSNEFGENCLVLTYGNTFQRATEENNNGHTWPIFVRLADKRLYMSKFVQKIDFVNYPTFKARPVEIEKPPYNYDYVGLGGFPIAIIIYFQSWLNTKPIQFKHIPSLTEQNSSQTVIIKFSNSLLQEESMKFDNIEEIEESENFNKPKPKSKTLSLLYGNILGINEESKKHICTTFLKLNDNALKISKYVDKVKFIVGSNKVEIKSTPFKMSQPIHQKSEAVIVIYWKAWLDMKPTILCHSVCLSGTGETKIQEIHFSQFIN